MGVPPPRYVAPGDVDRYQALAAHQARRQRHLELAQAVSLEASERGHPVPGEINVLPQGLRDVLGRRCDRGRRDDDLTIPSIEVPSEAAYRLFPRMFDLLEHLGDPGTHRGVDRPPR